MLSGSTGRSFTLCEPSEQGVVTGVCLPLVHAEGMRGVTVHQLDYQPRIVFLFYLTRSDIKKLLQDVDARR